MSEITHTPECIAADAARTEAIEAWKMRWPDACDWCGGRGAFYSGGSFDEMPSSDPCDECTDKGICARCGKPGLTSEERGDTSTGEGPCKECGWNYDDAQPPRREDPCACEEAYFREMDAIDEEAIAGVMRVEGSKRSIPDRRGLNPRCKNKIGSWRCGRCGRDVRKVRGPCKAVPRDQRFRLVEVEPDEAF